MFWLMKLFLGILQKMAFLNPKKLKFSGGAETCDQNHHCMVHHAASVYNPGENVMGQLWKLKRENTLR